MAVIIVTGANSGIGRATTLAFARRGDCVYAGVRAAEKGAELLETADSEGLDIHMVTLDVTHPESFATVLSGIAEEAGRIDVLVNNAGVLLPGAWEELPETAIRQVMETNFFGPMLLTRALLPHMREQGAGLIVMISSLSGIAGLAGDVAYSASKFALEGATEALRHEVDRWGIRLALVHGGQYATGLFERDSAGESGSAEHGGSPYAPLVQSKVEANARGMASAQRPEFMAAKLLEIVDSREDRLRWPADDLAVHVLTSLHGQSDQERDAFLRMAGDSDWWSNGRDRPE